MIKEITRLLSMNHRVDDFWLFIGAHFETTGLNHAMLKILWELLHCIIFYHYREHPPPPLMFFAAATTTTATTTNITNTATTTTKAATINTTTFDLFVIGPIIGFYHHIITYKPWSFLPYCALKSPESWKPDDARGEIASATHRIERQALRWTVSFRTWLKILIAWCQGSLEADGFRIG